MIDALLDPVADAKADTNVSGSRLKARSYVGGDGSKQWIGWYDSQRGEPCSFMVAGDGKTRCLPHGAGVIGFYAEATCTKPVLGTVKACSTPAPKYGIRYENLAQAQCPDSRFRVYSIGPALASTATLYQLSGTTCTATAATTAAIYFTTLNLYGEGAEVAASEFVDATEQHD